MTKHHQWNLRMNVTDVSSNSTTIEPFIAMNTSLQRVISEDEILGTPLVWTFLILRALQGILGMLGNLITIFAVFHFEFLWENSTSRMVAALALADFFGGLNPFCGIVTRHFISSMAVRISLCHMQVVTRLLTAYGNVYFTLLCTIDRYIFITRPLRYISIVTPKRASWAIMITWVLIGLQIALMMGLGPGNGTEFRCRYSRAIGKVAFYETAAQLFLITFCIIVPVYGVIAYESWKASQNEPHISNYPPQAQPIQKAKLRERRMVKTIGLVLGTYLTCYIPFLLYDIFTKIFYTTPFPFEILLIRKVLVEVYNMQVLLNPFLYGWKNTHFRRAYQKLLPQKCRHTPSQ